jgi:hypothetical protein
LLPGNFFSATKSSELRYRSHALDTKSLLRQGGLPVEMVTGEGIAIPYVDERDATWAGPMVFVAAEMFSANPGITAVALNLMSNYVYDLLKGRDGKRRARLSVVVESTKHKRTLRVDFDGPPENIPHLEKVIKSALG